MQGHKVEVGKITDGNAELGQHGIAISAEGCRWRIARGSISCGHATPIDESPSPRSADYAGKVDGGDTNAHSRSPTIGIAVTFVGAHTGSVKETPLSARISPAERFDSAFSPLRPASS